MEINPKTRSNNYSMNQMEGLDAFPSTAAFPSPLAGLLDTVEGLGVEFKTLVQEMCKSSTSKAACSAQVKWKLGGVCKLSPRLVTLFLSPVWLTAEQRSSVKWGWTE